MTRDPIVHGDEVVDEGVVDKRVLLEISEFGGTLAQMKRESSTLTAVLRDAFDGKRLSTPNKNNPCFATGAHFVTIGHVTREELTALLTQTDVMNGFANRFMMVYSARNKRVHEPQPTPPELVNAFAYRIAGAVKLAAERGAHPIARTEDARRRWIQMSDELECRVRPANIAKLMARDMVYLWTLSAALALINCEQTVDVRHLDAALAWLDFWEDTANFCFTTAARHDDMLLARAVADEIVEATRALGGQNVKHSDVVHRISNGGKRTDRTAKEISKGVACLQNEAPLRIRLGRQPGAGRTATTYSLVIN
jgi:putative DNA primase/helicase